MAKFIADKYSYEWSILKYMIWINDKVINIWYEWYKYDMFDKYMIYEW